MGGTKILRNSQTIVLGVCIAVATIMIICLVCFASTAQAGQKYNPFTNEWVTVPDNSEIKYNSFDNTWTYHTSDADIEYNPFNNEWEWSDGMNSQ